MTRAREGGFTLVEMTIALTLISVVFVAILDVMWPVIQTQATIYRYQLVQSEALLALKAVKTETAQASYLIAPAPGSSSDDLRGCANYSAALGGAIDSSQPVRGFQICMDGASLYRYSGTVCPMALTVCGTGQPELLANKLTHETGQPSIFVRPANQNTVEIHYAATGTGTSQIIDTAFAVQSAAGTNQ